MKRSSVGLDESDSSDDALWGATPANGSGSESKPSRCAGGDTSARGCSSNASRRRFGTTSGVSGPHHGRTPLGGVPASRAARQPPRDTPRRARPSNRRRCRLRRRRRRRSETLVDVAGRARAGNPRPSSTRPGTPPWQTAPTARRGPGYPCAPRRGSPPRPRTMRRERARRARPRRRRRAEPGASSSRGRGPRVPGGGVVAAHARKRRASRDAHDGNDQHGRDARVGHGDVPGDELARGPLESVTACSYRAAVRRRRKRDRRERRFVSPNVVRRTAGCQSPPRRRGASGAASARPGAAWRCARRCTRRRAQVIGGRRSARRHCLGDRASSGTCASTPGTSRRLGAAPAPRRQPRQWPARDSSAAVNTPSAASFVFVALASLPMIPSSRRRVHQKRGVHTACAGNSAPSGDR